ncbi:hypothetical protein D3C73_1026470 [compost metagenome]
MPVGISSLTFVDKLPDTVELQHYHFPVQDTSKGIKKSRFRNQFRNVLNLDYDESGHVHCSRSYCGNEAIQITSSTYNLGCDFECIDRFRNTSTFFTTQFEIQNMQRQLGRFESYVILAAIWGLKESLAKLLGMPLHEFLATRTLKDYDGGWHIANMQQKVHVYMECRGSNIIVVTYCERK